MLWSRTATISKNKQPCLPIEIKSTQQNWAVVSRAAPKEVCGYLLSCSTCNERSTHSLFVKEHGQSVASWKKCCCAFPDMLLVHRKELTSCLHLHKERALVWCQMAMCTDTEIMSWQTVGRKRSQITSFTLLSVGIEDSIYYFGNSRHHSCRWSHITGTEGRQQQQKTWILRALRSSLQKVPCLVQQGAVLGFRQPLT